MLTVDNQRYLLTLANRYSDDVITSIKNSTVLLEEDKEDCINVVLSNDFNEYTFLDTAVRNGLMIILKSEFCFIESETLLKLSEVVIAAMKNNNKAAEMTTGDIREYVGYENKQLEKINTMLCEYAEKIGK